jgi:AraC-like DNA-binding protein
MKLSEEEISRAKRAADIISSSLDVHYSIGELAKKVKLPESKLKSAFKQVYGVGVYTYLKEKRMGRAKVMMLEGKPIKLIIPEIGYESESNFCKAFRQTFNETPVSWKKKQQKGAA